MTSAANPDLIRRLWSAFSDRELSIEMDEAARVALDKRVSVWWEDDEWCVASLASHDDAFSEKRHCFETEQDAICGALILVVDARLRERLARYFVVADEEEPDSSIGVWSASVEGAVEAWAREVHGGLDEVCEYAGGSFVVTANGRRMVVFKDHSSVRVEVEHV